MDFDSDFTEVPKGPIDNIQALVQIMAWRRPGDKPLSEPMLIILLTHICVTQPQWVNIHAKLDMSTARRCRKSPRSLSGTSTHPTMVTLVNIMVLNGWLTSFSFHVNQAPHSWDKAISDSDLETPKVKVMGVVKGQGHTVGPESY